MCEGAREGVSKGVSVLGRKGREGREENIINQITADRV